MFHRRISTASSCKPLSPEEEELSIEKLDNQFAAREISTYRRCLRRFLITRKWDVGLAAKMLETHLQWRTQNLPVTYDEVHEVLDQGRATLLGSSCIGHPVWMLDLAKLLQVDWHQPGQMEMHIRAAVYCAEQMMASMDDHVDQWIAIVNCTGVRLPPMQFLKEFSAVFQSNYPNCACKILLYPVPQVLARIVNSFMSFVKKKTREKMIFVSTLEGLCTESGLPKDKLPIQLTKT